jgi:catechol 2,3-dioxygenase-like lactoylglutathione lyase family enzyme
MGILDAAKPAVVICTRDRNRAVQFYRDTLGLTLAFEDNLAAVFNSGGITLRISLVPDFTPHEHTILGFNVPDVAATVRALQAQGAVFNIYEGFKQDEFRYFDVAPWNSGCVVQRPGWQCAQRHKC